MGRIHDALERAEAERAGQRPASGVEPAESRRGDPAAHRQSLPEEDGSRLSPVSPVSSVNSAGEAAGPAHLTTPLRPSDGDLPSEASLRFDALPAAIAEQYKSLRARIQSMRRSRQIRSLVVTSARPGEGKTTTALHLAQSFGLERDFDTVLVDLDLRTPGLARRMSPPSGPGVADILSGRAALDELWIPVTDSRLYVLGAGELPENPPELLDSARMRSLVDRLHARFEIVVLDAPPVLGLPDVTQLVDLFDAVLFVVGTSLGTRRDIESSMERIDPSKVIGSVLNRCDGSGAGYGYGDYPGPVR